MSKKKVVAGQNIVFDLVIGLCKPGQKLEQRVARELHHKLKSRGYRICNDGSLVCDKAPDLSTVAFVIDAEKDFSQVARYITNHSKSKVNVRGKKLSEVGVIPVVFYNKKVWRDGSFGVVCSGGFVSHLVRLDGQYGQDDMLVCKSAQAAYDLLAS